MLQKSIFFLSLLIAKVTLGFDLSSNSNVAIYWGQNSEGSQERLSTYCQSDSVNIIMLSFLSSFPQLELNFANQCSTTFSDGLLHCSDIAEDIKTCQSLGKKVLLSLGGATGNYGFSSDSEATEFAQTLWNKFGGGRDNERPFDDAVIDGFDFDIENQQQTGYPALGEALRTYFAKDTSKTYYLSAAPQCPYPDQSVGELLSDVDVDFVFVQFYNNYCNLGSNFNWDTWSDYAEKAPNKDVKIFVGLPAGPSAASSGYSSASVVSSYIDSIKSQSLFGGISLWDASAAWANTDGDENYADQMKEILAPGSTSSSAISTLATSSKSTTSTSSTSTTSSLGTSSSTTSKLTSTTSSITSKSSSDTSLPKGTTYSTGYTSTLSSGTAYTSTSSTAFTSTLSTGTAYTSTLTSVYTSPLSPAPNTSTSTSDTSLPDTVQTSQKPPALLTTTKNAVTTLTTKLINNNVKVITDTASPQVETVTKINYVKTITSIVTGPPS